MPNTQRAQRLLTLFTSAGCAEGIVGDLSERREGGSIRFWWQISTTLVALWRSTLARAPLVALALGAAGLFLFGSAALSGVASVAVFPQQ